MRNTLLKISVILAVASLLPFFFMIARKQAPPPNVKIKASHEQTVENFTLEQIGNKKWLLKSPLAKFSGEKVVLQKPTVTVYTKKGSVKILSKEAIYDRKSGNSDLVSVKVVGKDFIAFASKGTFFGKRSVFKTDSYCVVNFRSRYRIKGKGCKIDFNRERVIIYSKVKTIIKGVKR